MSDGDELFRTYKDGVARFPGYLDDFAFFAAGCFDLFEATSDIGWLDVAEELVDRSIDLFWDGASAAFFYTAEHHKDLIVRKKEGFDNATPSSNSVAAMNLLRVAVATGRTELRDKADAMLKTYYDRMSQMPSALPEMLQALDLHIAGPQEIVCVTPPGGRTLAHDAWADLRPRALVFDVPQESGEYRDRVRVAQGRDVVDDRPTVYVCDDGVCELPRHEL
jgi:uncharacterized protein YyaL (SSP411 family)